MLLAGVFLILSANNHLVATVILKGNSTFNIGGFFNFYAKKPPSNSVNAQYGIMMFEALRFAVEKINSDPTILLGFQLKARIQDGTDPLRQVGNIVNGFATGSMPFAVGPLVNQDAFTASIVANSIDYPLVSYYASFDGIDTNASRVFFFRTVPSDAFRVRAALQLVQKMRWNFLSVISSFDKNGERMAKLFLDNLPNIGACLGDLKILGHGPKAHDYDNAVKYVSRDSRVRVLVLFTYYIDTREVLNALKRNNLTNRFYIFAASGLSNFYEMISGNEDVVEGSISIEFKSYPVPGFKEYIQSLTPTSCKCDGLYEEIFQKFWEKTFKCRLPSTVNRISERPPCTGNEKIQEDYGYYENTPVHTVIDAAYSLAYALQDFISSACKKREFPDNPCKLNGQESFYYVNTMRNRLGRYSYADGTLNFSAPVAPHDTSVVEFEIHNLAKQKQGFSNHNGYRTKIVGSWSCQRIMLNSSGLDFFASGELGKLTFNDDMVDWGKGRLAPPQSMCSVSCGPGEYEVRDRHIERAICCWECRKCPNNNIVANNTCKDCGLMGHPDPLKQTCVLLPQKHIRLSDDITAQVFVTLSSAGILAAIFLAFLFLKNNDHKVVKASGRDLCYFLILGIFMTFLTPFLFIMEPSSHICALRGIIPGLAFCMCYAPLFLKTNRIYRIFHHAQTSVGRPPLVSPQAQVVILFGIFVIQLLLGSIWLVSKPPKPNLFVSVNHDYMTEQCDNDVFPLAINMSVSVVLMIACTWQAFKTRNFPKNFNEAKYIGFTMYITCIFWAIFIPTYFISKNDPAFIREYLMCSICVSIGLITMLGLFGQKVKLLIMPGRVDLHGTDGQSITPSFAFKSEKKGMRSVKLGVLNENCEVGTQETRPSISSYSIRSDMSSK